MRYELRNTIQFDKWFTKLKDRTVKRKVLARLVRVENGSFGDHKQISPSLFELRLFFGPGLRIYYTVRNDRIIFLLAGGDKSSQKRDITKATELLAQLEE